MASKCINGQPLYYSSHFEILPVLWVLATQNVVCGGTTWVSPGRLSEMQNLKPVLDVLNRNLHGYKIPRSFVSPGTFQRQSSAGTSPNNFGSQWLVSLFSETLPYLQSIQYTLDLDYVVLCLSSVNIAHTHISFSWQCCDLLDQRLAKSVKGHMVNILGFAGHKLSLLRILFCLVYSLEV